MYVWKPRCDSHLFETERVFFARIIKYSTAAGNKMRRADKIETFLLAKGHWRASPPPRPGSNSHVPCSAERAVERQSRTRARKKNA
ncbi:Protein of unknown function [Gryllus bimaculatus]|nr:Protein of unknown function [Gryllus bimaculatus]